MTGRKSKYANLGRRNPQFFVGFFFFHRACFVLSHYFPHKATTAKDLSIIIAIRPKQLLFSSSLSTSDSKAPDQKAFEVVLPCFCSSKYASFDLTLSVSPWCLRPRLEIGCPCRFLDYYFKIIRLKNICFVLGSLRKFPSIYSKTMRSLDTFSGSRVATVPLGGSKCESPRLNIGRRLYCSGDITHS